MSWVSRQIAKIAPGYALKREVALRRLDRISKVGSDQERSFEAVLGGRMRHDFLTTSDGPDKAIRDGAESLRKHVRQLEYNNGFVRGPIRRIVNNVVGRGFKFQSRVTPDGDKARWAPFPAIDSDMAGRFNWEIERVMRKFDSQADIRLRFTLGELARTACSAWLRDGETIAVIRKSARKSRALSTCVQLYEIDRLHTPLEEINNPRIREGIRYDKEGVPESYFLLKNHPGESLAATLKKGSEFDEVPAWEPNGLRKVLHLFDPIRPEQSRGFTEFGPALMDFQDFKRYREAELYAALEDACLTGFVTTESPQDFQQAYTIPSDEDAYENGEYDRIHEFAPNKWHYLPPGRSVKIHSPNRPNQQFGQFMDQILEGPANALDIPPEILTQDWKGMNYSNARTVLLMFYLSCRVRQAFLGTHFYAPIYAAVAHEAIAKGLAKAPGFDRRSDDWLTHAWVFPGWQWVDPVKEANGKKIELENDMDTLSNICAGRGDDWEETLEQRARELKRKAELEAQHNIKFPKASEGLAPDADQDAADAAQTLGGLYAINGGGK
jgi:lambda family phage portal protein